MAGVPHRLRVTMDPERPDHADLLAAVETSPAGGGRRAWLRDLVMAGFRRVGTYEQWRSRAAGRGRPSPTLTSHSTGNAAGDSNVAQGNVGGHSGGNTPTRLEGVEGNGSSERLPQAALPDEQRPTTQNGSGPCGDESCAILKLL